MAAVYDVDERKRHSAAAIYDLDPDLPGPEAVIGHDDVDVVLVLTSMNEHGPLARAALEAGKHVLVEKPMATSLEEAAGLLGLSGRSRGLLVCAPHILLSPTFRAIHAAVRTGEIGRLLNARARYGWAGPDWGEWFYRPGGGSLFDLGVYNVTSLCALFGPARRVTAMVGVAIPEREVNGRAIRVEADDNAQVLLDFGEGRFASVTTGFTMQRYRSPGDRALRQRGDDPAPRRRLGAGGLGAVAERRGHLARLPRERPALAVDGGPAPPRRLCRERPADDHASRACLPRARDHARRAGAPAATASPARSRAASPIRSTTTRGRRRGRPLRPRPPQP